jgi:hypothetical protein
MSTVAPLPQVRLPPPPDRYERSWAARLLDELAKNFERRLSRETANGSILLQSPTGKVFEVSVDDDGTLTSRHVQG